MVRCPHPFVLSFSARTLKRPEGSRSGAGRGGLGALHAPMSAAHSFCPSAARMWWGGLKAALRGGARRLRRFMLRCPHRIVSSFSAWTLRRPGGPRSEGSRAAVGRGRRCSAAGGGAPPPYRIWIVVGRRCPAAGGAAAPPYRGLVCGGAALLRRWRSGSSALPCRFG